MKKLTRYLVLMFMLIGTTMNVQSQTDSNAATSYDSLATANVTALVNQYNELCLSIFNTPFNDSLRIKFNSIFRDDALVIRDYTTEKLALSPEEYVYYLNNYFGDSKPTCTIDPLFEIADKKFIASGNYYIIKVRINKQLTSLYDLDKQVALPNPASYVLQMEIMATESKRGTRILGIRDVTPVLVADVTKEKEKIVKEKFIKEKVEKVKTPKSPSAFDNLVFLNWSIGSDLSLSSANSESIDFKVTDFSYLGWQVGISGLKGLTDRIYAGVGLGFHFGNVTLNFDNTNFSYEWEDKLNPSVDTYTRNASISNIEETIKFTLFNLQALIYADLLQSENNKLLVGTGLSIGLPVSETSTVVATTKYTGTFHTVDGQEFPEPFTLGQTTELPIYGFQSSAFDKEFKLDSKMALSLPLNIKAIHAFDNNIFIGAGIEGLIPLSSWLEGESNHTRIFATRDDLDSSLANTVSKSKRPVYIGLGISIGILF